MSLIGLTVTVNVLLTEYKPPFSVPPSSKTTTVTSVLPLAFAASEYVIVPVASGLVYVTVGCV